jgi:hypothetical protein
MKKLTVLLFLLASYCCFGQQSITDKLVTSIKEGGAGVAYFNINYTAGTYQTKEADIVTANAADTNNITFNVHAHIVDSGKAAIDTNIVLTTAQVNLLNSFYQSASGGSNPDPAISNSKSGASGTLTVTICCGDAIDLTYSTPIHISLSRYLLSNWTNWN